MIQELIVYARSEPRDFIGGLLLWALLLTGIVVLLGMR